MKSNNQNSKNGRWLLKPLAILYSLYVFSILGLFASCGRSTIAKVSGVSCTPYLSDSITFSCISRDYSVIYGPNIKTNIYFYKDAAHGRLICFNGVGRIIDTIPIPDSLLHAKITGFCAITKDSFAFLQYKKLFLCNIKSKFFKEFNIDRHGMKCEAISNQYPLEIYDSLAFYYSFGDTIVLNTPKNWELNVDIAYDETVFNLNKDKIENIKAGGFPKEIYDDSNCYYSFWPSRCLNYKQHELVYLYRQSDVLYVFNYLTKTFRKIPIQNPDFLPNDKFDMNKMGDFNYLSKYETENCRNVAIVYNKFKNEYYVMFSPKCSYENPNSDEVLKPIDKPWSVLVLDSNFILKKKINFPAKQYYFAGIPLQRGLLVGYLSNFNATTNSSKYAIFEF